MNAALDLVGSKVLGYTVEERIGSGGYGTVYKVSKSNETGQYISALKHIVLPTETQYYDVLNSMGGDHGMAKDHFQTVLKNIIDEINLLQSLSEKNNNHIVTYYDNEVEKTENPLRYDIFIRMEYMKPFTKHLMEKQLTVEGVIDLGIDILSALELCHSNGVIHRDIKDDNLFVNKDGNFKIGDFGVAKALKDKSRAASMKGTPAFIAPEILALKEYDHTVDIYSLGILLYKLLNYARIPFLPPYPEKYTMDDIEYSIERRQKGEVPSRPLNAPDLLGEVVIKACSPREKRFNTAKEFQGALQKVKLSISREELEKVVMEPTKKPIASELVRPTLDGKTNNLDNSFDETIGVERPNNTSHNQTHQQTPGASCDIFETGGAYYSESKKNHSQTQQSKDINQDTFTTIGSVREEGHAAKDFREREPATPSNNTNFEFEKRNPFSGLEVNDDSSKVGKSDFSFIIYFAPVIVLIIAIIYYTNTFSFLNSVPYVDFIFSKLFFSLLISVSFITSLFFAAKQLHEKKKQTDDRAFLSGREPHHIMIGITSLFKEIIQQQENSTAYTPTLRKIEKLEGQLKIEQSFGNGKAFVIEIENEIACMLNEMKNQVVSLQKRNYGQLQQIEQLISNINEGLRRRREMLRR